MVAGLVMIGPARWSAGSTVAVSEKEPRRGRICFPPRRINQVASHQIQQLSGPRLDVTRAIFTTRRANCFDHALAASGNRPSAPTRKMQLFFWGNRGENAILHSDTAESHHLLGKLERIFTCCGWGVPLGTRCVISSFSSCWSVHQRMSSLSLAGLLYFIYRIHDACPCYIQSGFSQTHLRWH